MKKRFTIIALFLMLALPEYILAQGRIFVRNIETQDFPVLKADILAFDSTGNLIKNITSEDIRLTERSGAQRNIDEISCHPHDDPQFLSSVLAIDISSATGSGSPSGISLAQTVAAAWIEAVHTDSSESALLGFDHLNYLYQDFTQNSEQLLKNIARMQPKGGRNLNAAFLNEPAGAFKILDRGKFKRIIVLITGGDGGGSERKIIEAAQQSEAMVFVIGVRFPVSDVLKNIALKTGGQWFDNIRTAKEARQTARYVHALARGGKPCTISWKSQPDCFKNQTAQIELASVSAKINLDYTSPEERTTRLDVYPSGIDLGEMNLFPFKDTVITLTARNGDIFVTEIKSENPAFTIENSPDNFLLKENESQEIAIKFTPQDSTVNFGAISFTSDACTSDKAFLRGGFNFKTKHGLVKIITPNGGESIPANSPTLITWTGTLPQDTVIIEYSADGGVSWEIITKVANSHSYLWQTPDILSTKTRIRITERHRPGNTWRPLTALRHKDPVQRAILSPDGERVLTLDRDYIAADIFKNRTARFWDASNGKRLYTLPDSGRIQAIAYSRSGRYIATTLSDSAAYYLYDAQTGNQVGSSGTSKKNSAFTSIDFHPQDSGIVAGETDGNIYIQNIYFPFAPFTIIPGKFFEAVYSIRYSAGGQHFATASQLDSINVYRIDSKITNANTLTGKIVSDPFGYGPDITADGSRIVAAMQLTNTKIYPALWDVDAKDTIRTFAMPRGFARSNKFNWNDSLLIVGEAFDNLGEINNAYIFDVQSGALKATLSRHTSLVVDACFSKDSKRIATAGLDNSVIIWEKSPEPDTSDSFFSLVGTTDSSNNIDLGKIVVNASKDSIITSFLCNDSSTPLVIDSIELRNHRFSSFSVITENRFFIDSDSCYPVGFRFSPASEGVFVDTVRIFTSRGIIKRTIQAESVEPNIALAGFVDFGRVFIGNNKDSVVTVAIRNLRAEEIVVTRTFITGPDTTQFSLHEEESSFTLAPNESRSLKIRFSPDATGRTSSGIGFSFKNNDSEVSWPHPVIQLFGDGICSGIGVSPAQIRFEEPQIRASTGQVIHLPLKVIPPHNSLQNVPRGFTADIRFNKSVLLPVHPTPAGFIDGNDRVIRLSGKRDDTSNILSELTFTAALGDTDRMLLKIENFRWENCGGDAETATSEITIQNIIETDGAKRFFQDTELPGLLILKNPFGELAEIQYRLIEPGPTEIFLVNLTGRKISIMQDENAAPGQFIHNFNAHSIAAGVYFIVLKTPTQTITQRIEKLR